MGAVLVVLVGALILSNDAVQIRDARLGSFQRTYEGNVIVVTVITGIGERITGSSTVEDANTVRVIVKVRRSGGTVPAIALLLPTIVRLGAPLGDRTVLDAQGEPVPDLGDYAPPRRTPTP